MVWFVVTGPNISLSFVTLLFDVGFLYIIIIWHISTFIINFIIISMNIILRHIFGGCLRRADSRLLCGDLPAKAKVKEQVQRDKCCHSQQISGAYYFLIWALEVFQFFYAVKNAIFIIFAKLF